MNVTARYGPQLSNYILYLLRIVYTNPIPRTYDPPVVGQIAITTFYCESGFEVRGLFY